MKGFILSTSCVRDEDLIVRILTKNEILTLYRFYGARHSYINVGYFIDFIVEETSKSTIKRLRNVTHLPFDFLLDIDRMIFYKQFINLLNRHLFDITKIDNFYFDLLQYITQNISKRDPKRLLIESYVILLEKEGRLHKDNVCFLCERKIENDIVLARAFLPAHEKCVLSKGFNKEKIELLFNEKKSLLFSDREIDKLWNIVNLGL